jgi:hypothetical protein
VPVHPRQRQLLVQAFLVALSESFENGKALALAVLLARFELSRQTQILRLTRIGRRWRCAPSDLSGDITTCAD